MISVLMPVKNAGPYLRLCVQSLLNQTYTSWELIAVNDHSTDDSRATLLEYASQDKRIKCVDNTGQGIIDALRTAFELSTGTMVTRMDADDLMTADKLGSMHTILNQSGPGHLVTGFVEYFSAAGVGDGYRSYAQWLNQLSAAQNNFEEIYKECVIPSPCWMVFRTDLERCGGFESDRYPEDYDLCFRFREANLKVRTVKKVIHHWRDHADRASRNDPHYLDNRFLDLKLYHFFKSDYDASTELILWGAGKKAKFFAQHMIHKEIQFRWLCNNPNKIGKDIYGHKIEGTDVITEIKQGTCLVAVANQGDQTDIRDKLQQLPMIKSYFMC